MIAIDHGKVFGAPWSIRHDAGNSAHYREQNHRRCESFLSMRNARPAIAATRTRRWPKCPQNADVLIPFLPRLTRTRARWAARGASSGPSINGIQGFQKKKVSTPPFQGSIRTSRLLFPCTKQFRRQAQLALFPHRTDRRGIRDAPAGNGMRAEILQPDVIWMMWAVDFPRHENQSMAHPSFPGRKRRWPSRQHKRMSISTCPAGSPK